MVEKSTASLLDAKNKNKEIAMHPNNEKQYAQGNPANDSSNSDVQGYSMSEAISVVCDELGSSHDLGDPEIAQD